LLSKRWLSVRISNGFRQSNENKISDGYRERASIEVEVF
jgi:hypothetical protein